MLIPLGIIASSGKRAGGSYELIETITVGSGGAASVTFSNLNTYSTTYQHLQIRAVAKGSGTGDANGDDLNIQLNSVTSAAYSKHYLYTISTLSTPASGGGANTSSMIAGKISTNYSGTSASAFSAQVIDILDPYETTKNTTIRAFSGHLSARQWVELSSGAWYNTNAVTDVKLYPGVGSFLQGSRFSIYGLKAS